MAPGWVSTLLSYIIYNLYQWPVMDESFFRGGAFIFSLSVFAVAEAAWPRRQKSQPVVSRWAINLSFAFINMALTRLLLGSAAVAAAAVASERGWGALNYFAVPEPAAFVLSFAIMDFSIYAQHILSHYLPVFWRLHLAHHTDLDFDVTTASRFHPVEIIVSMVYKMAVVAAIGADPLSVVVFEVFLNAFAQFNHSNLALPGRLDDALRRVIVTPDMHRIHHSTLPEETNSNFGSILSVWDRAGGTYRREARKPQEEIDIGLREYRDPEELSWTGLMTIPLTAKTDPGPNRRRKPY